MKKQDENEIEGVKLMEYAVTLAGLASLFVVVWCFEERIEQLRKESEQEGGEYNGKHA